MTARLPIPDPLEGPLGLLREACQAHDAIIAAWVEGSLARGEADAWSDIDLHLEVTDESFDPHSWMSTSFPLVLADRIPGTDRGYVFLTSDWVHIDVVLHAPQEARGEGSPRWYFLAPEHQGTGEGGLRQDRPPGAGVMDHEVGAPYWPAQDCRVVLYLLGSAVGLLARDDLLALSQTVSGLRDGYLVRLMLAENGVRPGTSAKRRLSRLTPEQAEALFSLPPLGLDRDGLLSALRAIAAGYLSRARALSGTLGEEWPQGLDDALRSLWKRELGLELS